MKVSTLEKGVLFFDERVSYELYDTNWCAICDTPVLSLKNSIKFINFDTLSSSFSKILSKIDNS